MRGDMRGDMRGRDGSAALVMAALVMAAKIYRKILFLSLCATLYDQFIVAKYC